MKPEILAEKTRNLRIVVQWPLFHVACVLGLLAYVELATAQPPRPDDATRGKALRDSAARSPVAQWPADWNERLEKAAARNRITIVATDDQDSPVLALVLLKTEQERNGAADLLPNSAASYANGELIWLTQAQQHELGRRGIPFRAYPTPTRIGHQLLPFDTRSETIVLPPNVPRFAVKHQGKQIFWIQFVGPIQDAWLAQIKERGIEPLTPYPHFAYLVWASDAQMAEAALLPGARWTGPYAPGFKLSRELIAPLLLEDPAVSLPEEPTALVVCALLADHLNETIFANLERAGARVDQRMVLDFYEWARVTIRAQDIPALIEQAGVLAVELYHEPQLEDEVSDQIVAGNHPGGIPTAGYQSWLAAVGVDGTGVTVGVVDNGVNDAHPDLTGRVVSLDYGDGSAADGHGHHVAGIVAGNASLGTTDGNGFRYGLGAAPGANLIDQPASKGAASATYQQLVRDCVRTTGTNGVTGYIQNNSWGLNGGAPPGTNTTYESDERLYDIFARDADNLTAGNQPLVICFSAGNDGDSFGCPAPSETLTRPKAAKNIIAVGATNNYRPPASYANNINDLAVFSSRGPAKDGRIKPDVCAPGAWIASLLGGSDPLWGDIDANYRWSGGTSMAAPHIAGAAALLTQWWQNGHGGSRPSPALVKAFLINSAADMNSAGNTISGCSSWESTTPTIPNQHEGWGRPNLRSILQAPVPIETVGETVVFGSAGNSHVVGGQVADSAYPLRVTLVWTDAPAAIGANPALVNDLDLTVVVGSNTYRGNNFSGGLVVPGGSPDAINNVENVFLAPGTSGALTITVSAAAINGDGIPGNADLTDQDFALVIYNYAPSQVRFATATSNVAETSATAAVRVLLEIPAGPGGAQVDYSVTTATATGGGVDYSLPGSGTVSFAAGQTSATISLAIHNDSIHESAEMVRLALSNPVGTALAPGGPITHTVSILDDDAMPVLGPLTAVVVNEGDASATLTLVLSGNATALTVSVDYATTNATAAAGSDFAPASGTLLLLPPATSGTITVAIVDDYAVEGPESFYVLLRNVENATPSTTTLTVRIEDNDSSSASVRRWRRY